MDNEIKNEKLEKENIKEEAFEGFKLWLDQIGLGSENFKEEHYDIILLMSLYQNYQYQVEQFVREQEKESSGKKLFVPEDSADKNKGKIIRPDFGNK